MKKLTVLLVLAMAAVWSGCGDSATQPVVNYVARGSSDSWAPHIFKFNIISKASTAVAIPLPTTAGYVAVDAKADDATYCDNGGTVADIFTMGTDGTPHQLTTDADACESSFSPDAKTIAYVDFAQGVNSEISTMNADGTNQATLYFDITGSTYAWEPQFSPEGKSVVFYIEVVGGAAQSHKPQMHSGAPAPKWPSANRGAKKAGRVRPRPNGFAPPTQSGWYTMALTDLAPTLVYATTDFWGPASFSFDGKKLLMSVYDGTEWNIASINLDGTSLTPLTTGTTTEAFGTVAVNGLILYNIYNSTNSSADIYVMQDTGASQTLLSTADVNTWESLNDTFYESF